MKKPSHFVDDREGRKVTKRTALDLAENNFDLMFEQLKELKSGKTIEKPIYNHVNGEQQCREPLNA